MNPIHMETIARALWDEYLARTDEPNTPVKFTTFRDAMLRTGTMSSLTTIRTKWIAFSSTTGVTVINDKTYLIDRRLFAMAHGIAGSDAHTHHTHTYTHTAEEASE